MLSCNVCIAIFFTDTISINASLFIFLFQIRLAVLNSNFEHDIPQVGGFGVGC